MLDVVVDGFTLSGSGGATPFAFTRGFTVLASGIFACNTSGTLFTFGSDSPLHWRFDRWAGWRHPLLLKLSSTTLCFSGSGGIGESLIQSVREGSALEKTDKFGDFYSADTKQQIVVKSVPSYPGVSGGPEPAG